MNLYFEDGTVLRFPRHEAELCITHNPHKTNYTTLEEWEREMNWQEDDWASVEERTLALEADEVWQLVWYPNSPVGHYMVLASTFEAAVKVALQLEDQL